MFLIYRVIYSLVILFLLPFEYIRRPGRLRGRWLREKFGGSMTPDRGSMTPDRGGSMTPSIWVHAVSVGEVMASVPFIIRLRELYPDIDIIVSTITDTGQDMAIERLSSYADIIYLPYDITSAIKRALKRLKPSVFVTMETELWPALFRALKAGDVPIVVMNGRISDKSFEGYKKIRFFISGVLGYVSVFCMQEPLYAGRIVELGAEREKVKVIGNFKFDIRPPSKAPRWTGLLKGPVIVAGSTHKGEEELIVSAFMTLRNDFPELNLVLAPRHPGRFKEAADIVASNNIQYIRRSEISVAQAGIPNVVLLDTIGELSAVYGAADVAVIGGSFVGHGGHNPLEPAYWGKPFVCGPHMENFPFADFFFIEGAALKAGSAELYGALKGLLSSPEKRRIMGLRGKALYEKNSGAVEKAVEVVAGFLGKKD